MAQIARTLTPVSLRSRTQVFFAILLIWGVVCLPESPRWLMHEGRHVDAQRVVAALADDAYDSEATILQTRLIMQSIEQSHQLGVIRKRNMFSSGATQHFRRMLCGATSQIAQQLGGCNVVIWKSTLLQRLSVFGGDSRILLRNPEWKKLTIPSLPPCRLLPRDLRAVPRHRQDTLAHSRRRQRYSICIGRLRVVLHH